MFLIYLVTFYMPAVIMNSINIKYYDNVSIYRMKNDCYMDRTCFANKNNICLNTKIHYKNIGIIEDLDYPYISKMAKWDIVKFIPTCWPHIQYYYCSNFFAKCENNKVLKPNARNCKYMKHSCRFILKRFYPSFLFCDKYDISGCSNSNNLMNISSSNKCIAPLIYSNNEAAWHSEIDKCAYPCNPLIYEKDQRDLLLTTTSLTNIISCLISFITLDLFLFYIKKINGTIRNPILYSLLCNFISNFLFCLPINNYIRNVITCAIDSTTHTSKSRNTNMLFCNLSFILLYFSSLSSKLWYLLNTFNSFKKQKNIKSHKSCSHLLIYHFISWGIPTILIILIYSFVQIVGINILGICFMDPKSSLFGIFFTQPLLALCLTGIVISYRTYKIPLSYSINQSNLGIAPDVKDFILWIFCIMIIITLAFVKKSLLFIGNMWHQKILSDYLWCNISSNILPDQFTPSQTGKNECHLQRLDSISMQLIGIALLFMFRTAIPFRVLSSILPNLRLKGWKVTLVDNLTQKSSPLAIDSDPNDDSDCDYEASDELVGPVFSNIAIQRVPLCSAEVNRLPHQPRCVFNHNDPPNRVGQAVLDPFLSPTCPYCTESNASQPRTSLRHDSTFRSYASLSTSWTSGTLSVYRAQREKMARFMRTASNAFPHTKRRYHPSHRWSSNSATCHHPYTGRADGTLNASDPCVCAPTSNEIVSVPTRQRQLNQQSDQALSSKAQAIFERRKLFRRYCRYVRKSHKKYGSTGRRSSRHIDSKNGKLLMK